MRFRAHTEIGFKAMVLLGQQEGRPMTLRQLNSALGVSKNHLRKVVQHLAHGDFVRTAPGRSGGIRLGRDPNLIRLGTLLCHLETEVGGFSCSLTKVSAPNLGHCHDPESCPLRKMSSLAVTSLVSKLDEFVLADLISRDESPKSVDGVQLPTPVTIFREATCRIAGMAETTRTRSNAPCDPGKP